MQPADPRLLRLSQYRHRSDSLCITVDTTRWFYFRQHFAWNIQFLQDFFVPFSFMYIKEHRSGCIGVIGDMCLPACQFPDQPRIYSSKQQFAIFCTFSALFDMIKDPGKFGRRKVSIWDQSCFFVDFSPNPSFTSSSTFSAVLRHCQTIALYTGFPVAFSQTIVVSL